MLFTYIIFFNIFYKHLIISIKALGSLKSFNHTLSLLLIKIDIFLNIDLLHTNIFNQYLVGYLLDLKMHLVLQIQYLLLLAFYMDDLEYMATLNYALFYFHWYNYQN